MYYYEHALPVLHEDRERGRGHFCTIIIYFLLWSFWSNGHETQATLYVLGGFATIWLKLWLPTRGRQETTLKRELYFMLWHLDAVVFCDIPFWPLCLLLALCGASYRDNASDWTRWCIKDENRNIPHDALCDSTERKMRIEAQAAQAFEGRLEELEAPARQVLAVGATAALITTTATAQNAGKPVNPAVMLQALAFTDAAGGDSQFWLQLAWGSKNPWIIWNQNYRNLDGTSPSSTLAAGRRIALKPWLAVSAACGPQYSYDTKALDRLVCYPVGQLNSPYGKLFVFNRLTFPQDKKLKFADRHFVTFTPKCWHGRIGVDFEIQRTAKGIAQLYAGSVITPLPRQLPGLSLTGYYDQGRGAPGLRIQFTHAFALRR